MGPAPLSELAIDGTISTIQVVDIMARSGWHQSIPGVLATGLVEDFVQTQAGPETRRNPGGTSTLSSHR